MSGSRKYGSFFGLASVLLLAACSGPSADSALYSVVDGVWSTSCIPSAGLFKAYRVELQLENARKVARVESYHDDADCAEPLATLRYEGQYELMVTARDFIYGIDLIFQEQALTALNDLGQQRLEASSFCGHREWPLAVTQKPLSFDPDHCTAIGPLPLKNLNLVAINRGYSLNFGTELAHENERPVDVRNEPQFIFLSKP